MFSQQSKVFVALLVHINSCLTVPLSEFYPYGVSEGDTALPPNDDGSSGVIPISIQFPYFDRNHDSLYVNTNGVVSFLVAVSQYTPLPFPLGMSDALFRHSGVTLIPEMEGPYRTGSPQIPCYYRELPGTFTAPSSLIKSSRQHGFLLPPGTGWLSLELVEFLGAR
ncbi:hypothetical protein OS493_002698 [Desmophyllum pertusum]|uniref:Uncharacterized protein n=1 Tax=Desmophyllum pertusum TaxID=174260 RepID=A0A9W9YTD0_9CNID|nr:hypothetical protein OS493_002698 [Desmophyllum pertusum]